MRGSTLAVFYCLGLGIPFVAAAFAAEKVQVFSRFIRRHALLLMRIGGVVLIVVGLLEVTGVWGTFVTWLQDNFSSVQVPL